MVRRPEVPSLPVTLSSSSAGPIAWPQAMVFPCGGGAAGSPSTHVPPRWAPSCPPATLLQEFSPSRGWWGFRTGCDDAAGTRGTETAPVLLQLPVSCCGLQK